MIDTELLRISVGNLDEERVTALLEDFFGSGPGEEDARTALTACQEGMYIVGERFENGTYFVGDLVFAGSMLAAAVEKFKPLLGFGAGGGNVGVVVLGTVEGDIHFIGKNLFKTMLETENFRVIDIGIDQPPKAFVEAAEKYGADIAGLSGLLTTAVDSMRETVLAFEEAGIRKRTRIFIGGSIVTDEICAYVGADDWSRNAYEAVRRCLKWMGAE